MILKIINLMLGDAGRFIRDFYFDNSLWINALVFGYALFIIWNHSNLRSLYLQIEKDILRLIPGEKERIDWIGVKKELSDQLLENNRKKLFLLPSKNDMWYQKMSVDEIFDEFFIDVSFIKMVCHQKTGYPPIRSFTHEEFSFWTDYIHFMKRGLRSNLKDPKAIIEI